MVLMAAPSSGHRHRRAAKSSPPADPVTLLPSAAKASVGDGLHGFSFRWGAQRRLRCSKDGTPAYASPSSPYPPTQHPHTSSPDKENPEPLPQGDGDRAGTGSSSRPLRSRNLRPLRYTAVHPGSLISDGPGRALNSPSAPPSETKHRKRGFAVALSKEEIARDFAAIRCGRPPPRRRGKKEKRPKPVQKKIDSLCPGFDLANIDMDNYIEERGLR